MLTRTSRVLTYFVAALYAVLGCILFLRPEQTAPVFAWKVTAFMTMTIGGWCLGNAWLAWHAARRWRWMFIHPGLVYLWTFGVLETLIVILFRGKLQLGNAVAWLYLSALAINVAAAVVGTLDWIRLRPARSSTRNVTPAVRFWQVFFVVFVGFLGLYGLLAPVGAFGTKAQVFPELMSPFTLKAFGAFYLSLAIGMIPVLSDTDHTSFLSYGFLALALIVMITAAAVIYLGLFDFRTHPGQAAYFGAYVGAAVVLIYFLWKHGTGNSAV
jgi:hypothetical protein